MTQRNVYLIINLQTICTFFTLHIVKSYPFSLDKREGLLLKNNFSLTVRDVLNRETFRYAKLLAGEGGLDKQIKWAHILETKDFESLLNGGELILTTGLGLELDSSSNHKTYELLMKKNVSCLCIEKGSYFHTLSPEIKQLADQDDFPIIIFEKVVKFVDITLDLHTLIINQHYQMLNQLNEIAKEFTNLSLTHNGTLKILQRLSNYLHKKVIFMSKDEQSFHYPPETKHFNNLLQSNYDKLQQVKEPEIKTIENQDILIYPCIGLGQVWGHLCLEVASKDDNEFTLSVLDRCASAIAQILLRNRTIEERKLNQEDEVVQNCIQGKKYPIEELMTLFPFPNHFKNDYQFRTIVIQTDFEKLVTSTNEWEELKLQLSLSIRTLFSQQNFVPIISVRKNQIVIICFSQTKETIAENKNKLRHLSKKIISLLSGKQQQRNTFGISRLDTDISLLKNSFSDAKKSIRLQEANLISSPFYEDIGIHHLFFQLKDKDELTAFIDQHIGPLINYDKENDSDLLRTLSTYLDCLGSKKEAAEQLFIVRQTLYHRLEKIQQLLGNDLLEPASRSAIEVAIKAHYFQHSKAT